MAVATDTSSHSNGQDTNGTSGVEDALQALLMRQGGESGSDQSYVDLLGSSSSASSTYLHSLTSKSLADLRLQPSALTTTIHSLDGQLSTLCARHVDSFVQVRHASSSLPRALDDLDAKLDSLLDDALPRLVQATQQFPSASQPHFQAKARAQALLRQHQNSLADVLELPALLATCVRANHPVEALQLGIHIARLSRPANPNLDDSSPSSSTPLGKGARGHGVLVALRREAWQHLAVLRDDLLKGLDTRGLRLPVARRYVSLLKTFSDVDREAGHANTLPQQQHSSKVASLPPKLALSDSMLCLSLLRSRYAALVSRLDNATASQAEDAPATAMAAAASRCSTRIGIWREAVYDAIGMSLALFVDRPPHSSLSHHHHKEGEDLSSTKDMTDDGDLSPTMLISAFASKTLILLQSLLDADIPDITSSAFQQQQVSNAYARTATDVLSTFASLHTQLSYASASLARLGLDFSSTLTGSLASSSSSSAFEHGVLQVWTLGLRRAIESFTQRWTACVGSGSGNGNTFALLAPQARNVESISKLLSRHRSAKVAEQEEKRMTLTPCQDLMDVPALALLLNNLLEAYNALQGFCPASISTRIVEELDEALEQVLVLALQFQERLDLSEEGTMDAENTAQGNRSSLDANLLPALFVSGTEQEEGIHDRDEVVAASTRDAQRIHEAQRMLASAISVLLEQDVVGFVRGLVVELVSAESHVDEDDVQTQTTAGQRCSQRRREVVAWAEGARKAWDIGEKKREGALKMGLETSRKERERVESERTARLKREEEEAAKRAEEEKEAAAERARLIKEQEEAAEKARKEAEEKQRLEEEEEERARRAKQAEEGAARKRESEKREEEERLEREKEEREAAEKQRKEQEEKRLREEQERLRREEEEARARREEEERLKREEEERLRREEEERTRIEEGKRIEREKEKEAEKQRRREEEERQREEQEERARREQEALAAAKKAQEEQEERKREEAEAERKKAAMAREEEGRKTKAEEEAKQSATAKIQAEVTKPEEDGAGEAKPSAESTAPKKAGSSALADKLRKAREERERAAAEAKTATSSSESAPVLEATGDAPVAEKAKTEATEDADAVAKPQQRETLQEGQETPVSKGSQSSGEDDGDEEGNEGEGKEGETATSSSAAAAKKKAKKKRQKKKKAGTAAASASSTTAQ